MIPTLLVFRMIIGCVVGREGSGGQCTEALRSYYLERGQGGGAAWGGIISAPGGELLFL